MAKIRIQNWHKLVLIVGVFLLPMALVTVFLLLSLRSDVDFAESELLGTRYLRALYVLHAEVAKNRIGLPSAVTERTWASALNDVDDIDELSGELLETSELWSALRPKLNKLPSQLADAELSIVATELRSLINKIGDTSKLILDPDLDTYYLMDIVLLRLFNTASYLHEMGRISTTDALPGAGKTKLDTAVLGRLEDLLNAVDHDLSTASSATQSEAVIDDIAQIYPNYRKSLQRIISLATADQAIADTEWQTAIKTAFDTEQPMFGATVDGLDKLLNARIKSIYQVGFMQLAAVFITALLSTGFGVWLIQRQSGRLNAAVGIAKRVAEGDFSVEFGGFQSGDTHSVISAFQIMVEALETMILQARATADDLSEASGRLGAVSTQAAGTSRQISVLADDMTTAVEMLAKRIEAILIHVREAETRSRRSMELCRKGEQVIKTIAQEMELVGATVDTASHAIQSLEQQSHQISSIVSVIKEIADQTNLLALNAAIEAARAGEQGRGFSVVADEVRQLAFRTSQSTQEITQMIAKIQEGTQNAVGTMATVVTRVQQGSAMAVDAGQAISDIQSSVTHVSGVVSAITHDVDEQSAASSAIQLGIDRIAAASKDNTVAVEETAVSAQRLADHANDLKDWVSMFKIRPRIRK